MNEVHIYLTKHVQERFAERIGTVSDSSIIGWIKNSLRHSAPQRLSNNSYRIKLRGTPYKLILSHVGKNRWVAVTIIPPHSYKERGHPSEQNNKTADA